MPAGLDLELCCTTDLSGTSPTLQFSDWGLHPCCTTVFRVWDLCTRLPALTFLLPHCSVRQIYRVPNPTTSEPVGSVLDLTVIVLLLECCCSSHVLLALSPRSLFNVHCPAVDRLSQRNPASCPKDQDRRTRTGWETSTKEKLQSCQTGSSR
jgi:hypothetical protein